MRKTVRKKRRARDFIRTHVKQMSAFLLTEGIALHGVQRSPDGSIFDVLVIRKGLADKWVDEHEWHPNEHFLYKVWYYADYTPKTMPKYLSPEMITFINLNHALQRAQEDGDTEMTDLIKRALKDYDYKSKIRRDPI
ncbi:MAG: hypothetical protein J6Y02_10020 [Pseudobutyrivibrio sp.]|nr:hypothetical protein [Pseudobutyrivibrio sp.]